MTRQLIFLHGRAQEFKDADNLKAHWIATWTEGLRKSDLQVPIAENDIRFPYYGQTLCDLTNGASSQQAAEVIIRGADGDAAQKEFIRSVLKEMCEMAGITDQDLEAVMGKELVERGVLNWEWVQAILKAVDCYLPGASGLSIALATNDVYQYLFNPGVRDVIETGVRKALNPGVPCVVVSHSLGTVVAYNMLRRDGADMHWKVPLLVTVGSPLAVTAVKNALRPIQFPTCVTKWYNSMDKRDVVALYPLDQDHFDVAPAIENNTNVDNQTENRHGIAGYLNDKDVARKIYDALMSE